MPDIDNMSMLELFQLECEELLKGLNRLILTLENQGKEKNSLEGIKRIIHTIKGSAKTIMINEISDFAHAAEDHLARLQGQKTIASDDVDYLLIIADWIKYLIQLAVEEKPFPPDLQTMIRHVSQGDNLEPLPSLTEKCFAENTHSRNAGNTSSTTETKEQSSVTEDADVNILKSDSPGGIQRISVKSLDSLFNLVGELYIKGTGIDQLKNDMIGTLTTAMLMTKCCKTLSSIIEEIDTSDSTINKPNIKHLVEELTQRSTNIQQRLNPLYQTIDDFNTQFQFLTSSLKEEVMEARLVPLSQLFDIYPRIVRELAKSLGKTVQLEINGSDTKIDKSVIEILKVPLEHLIRNAIDHGIEPPEIRQSRGKAVSGKISFTAFRQGDEIIIRLEDDGQGIDAEVIRSKIVDQNRLSEAQAAKLQKKELLEFVFLPGFSTRDRADGFSGRGVGMSIVKTDIEKINGHVSIESSVGQSTLLTLRLPLSLVITHTLLVETNRQIYAFPTNMVEEYLHVCPGEIQTIGGKHMLHHHDKIVAVTWLNQLMGGEFIQQNPDQLYPALLFQMGDSSVAIIADRFIGENEIVIKPLDSRLKKVQHMTGASISNDGKIILLVDVADILQTIKEAHYIFDVSKTEKTEPTQESKQILIVEDSLTVREMERKLLQSAGYDVTLAVDGQDGLNKIRQKPFDLIISDIDMPHLDGLNMTKTLKKDDKYCHIPVIIVSYKDSLEDKQKGLEAGADHYIAKSQFNSDEFIKLIDQLI